MKTAPLVAVSLSPRDLNAALGEPQLSVMNFLNEVKIHYPQAISFSAGRPAEDFFHVREVTAKMDRFLEEECRRTGLDEAAILGSIGQYGRTNGIIGPHLARHLAIDEHIRVDPEDIVVTSGCQEAMALVLIGLLRRRDDVLLTADPTYIGMTGLARLLGIEVVPVACGAHGIDLHDLARQVAKVRAAGKNPRAVYAIPDFNNPLGCDMPHDRREALLALADKLDFLIVEDNPYGMFGYDDVARATLKSLDRHGRVIYLGTFSKTLFPSLRLGFLVTDIRVRDEHGASRRLTEMLSPIKSLTTVNTSALLQAMVGGVLIDADYSLRRHVAPVRDHYRTNRDAMLDALEGAFPAGDPLRASVTWNRPNGGFFLTMTLPFPFDDACLEACAAQAGVIVVPMSYFALTPGRANQIRLSFCANTPSEIDRGVARLAEFIRRRIA
ncbi:PLP-dependent aminotransferase family protein [Sulfidibacter corallicola]|uniref:PLP-dependent aminotransferase family protein n=1 Tax=Sulfidibacter corallicola TaxID=2818388 RepID=A0A8A4THG5_SULCO|nr:PLP-dependent aminotransferase family protein [Sulfidibacter corallicola]QTD48644.1 PLP-dependent aminotransferase family protein [Sulfidibacter corallicola]